jgi:hypothetical protein
MRAAAGTRRPVALTGDAMAIGKVNWFNPDNGYGFNEFNGAIRRTQSGAVSPRRMMPM